MNKKALYDNIFRATIVIVSSTIYSLSVIWFLEPANLVGTGFTGIGQIVIRILANFNIKVPLGVVIFLMNIPLCIYGIKNVSRRFIIFTILSIFVQSFWLLGWSWLNVDLGIKPDNQFFLSFMGGLVGGLATGLALRYGTSTGGIDIIGQSLALKKNISIGVFSMIINILIAIIAGGIMEGNWSLTLYTFVYIIITNIVVDKIHTAYNYLRVDIISTKSDEIAENLVAGINRSCTIGNVRGGYTHQDKYDIFMIISSYELSKAVEIIKKADPYSFITVSPVKRIFGTFFKHTIT